MYTVGLIEDEKALNNILKLYLSREGLEVLSYENIEDLKFMHNKKIDIWVIDIMLPDGDGFEILKYIKNKNKDLPVILISARGESVDRVIGFEMGCDDYLSKPFSPKELVFRVKKLIERVYKNSIDNNNVIKVAEYIINTKTRSIYKSNESINLTSKEYDIVIYFVKNNSNAISREQIISTIWDDDYFGSDRAVDSYIKRIRKKMPLLNIETIYGYGYRCNI